MAIDSIDLTFTSGGDTSYNYYVRLGALLQFIEEKIMYQAKALNSTTLTPMLKFDYDVDSNLMYIDDEYQTSIDPSICVINRTVLDYLSPPAVNITNFKGDAFDSPLFSSLPTVYGQIMNIYVNMSFILTKMDELKDANTNKVTLIDLINNILSAINSSLGGTTSLEANIDEDTNTLTIRDANPLPNADEVIKILNAKNPKLKIPNKYTQFELYGYNGSSASFIKDFSLKTEITPELSTMITVAATANSTVVGENSTAFSKFNAGLTDRFKTEIEDYSPSAIPVSVTAAAIGFGINSGSGLFGVLNTSAAITAANVQAIKDAALAAAKAKYLQTLRDYQKYLRKLVAGDFNKEEAETYKNALNNIITYKQQWLNAMYNKLNINTSIFSPSTGFIPFNLSLTMDGLSGMKIYSKFLINTEFLPANYPNNAEFLIKSIQHKIENNKWFTTLESIVISKGDTDKSIYNKNKPASVTVVTPPVVGGGGGGGITSTPPAVPPGRHPLLEKAVKDQAAYVYATFGAGRGFCAGWTSTIANKIKAHIDATSPNAIPTGMAGWGDANSSGFETKAIASQLYDKTLDKEYPYNDLKAIMNNTTWNYGDIVQYYTTKLTATGASVPTNTKMHAQIYTGTLYGNGGWSCDNKTNWNTNVVFSTRQYTFRLKVYRVKSLYQK
jgi:hypothetical protein